MDMKHWLDRVTEESSVNAIAREARVPHKTLDTQLRSQTGLKPDMVVKIARTYGVSPVGALVELGLITDQEARDIVGIDAVGTAVALRRADDGQLLDEIGRRLAERSVSLDGETGEALG